MSTEKWVVHKFGGTSVAGAERYRAVAGIVRERRARDGGRSVAVDWQLSREKLTAWLKSAPDFDTLVVTGFIASTRAGVATTLKRNGSDFSASIFAALLDAASVTIRTDVDGVLSADPRRVPDALVVPRLSYQEAAELASFGAKVIHPNTMSPVIAGRIPIAIKNTFNPSAAGSVIAGEGSPEMPVKGFASVEGMTLANVERTGMAGVPGIANKLFGALRAQDVSVVLIYIFNTFGGAKPFSQIVREAHARGYTEPDPREDLSGLDVARKLVILAREMGAELELSDVEVESLVPEDLRAAGVEEFPGSLGRHDEAMAELLESAREKLEVLRYVGSTEPGGKVSAGLRAFPVGHAFASLTDSDNVVSFRTARYNVQPMIVRGPGAGPDVTAAGVFADLLRLASFLGAPL
jgi:Homoserine dehydrogenase/Amino acid kinase family